MFRVGTPIWDFLRSLREHLGHREIETMFEFRFQSFSNDWNYLQQSILEKKKEKKKKKKRIVQSSEHSSSSFFSSSCSSIIITRQETIFLLLLSSFLRKYSSADMTWALVETTRNNQGRNHWCEIDKQKESDVSYSLSNLLVTFFSLSFS